MMDKKQMSQALRQLREDDKPQFSRSLYACDEDLYKAKSEYFEQQNTALMAQVEELKEAAIYHLAHYSFTSEHGRRLNKAIQHAPKQSLESLKAKIEDETIKRCKGHLNPITSGMIWRTELCGMLNDIPRKYSKEEE